MNEEQTEGMLLTATPDTNSIDTRRSSAGEAATRASSSQSNSEGKIIPHYLRSSTGSCHDFCKYGRKHTFESRGRNPTFPRYSEKGHNWVPSLGEKQQKPAVKQKRAAHPETGSYNRPKTSEGKAFSPMKTVKPIQMSEINKHDATCDERSGSSDSQNECNFPSSKEIEPLGGFRTIEQVAREKTASCDDTETTTQDNPAFLKKTEASTDTHKRKPSPHKVHLSPESSFAEQRSQSARKIFASAKSKVEQKTPSPVKKIISSGKAEVSKQVSPSPANRFGASARPVLPGKSNVKFVKSESQLKPATGMAGRHFERKIVKNDPSIPRGKKILKFPLDSLSPQPPPNHVSKSASPVKDAREVKKSIHKTGKIREKPLHIFGQGPTENENTKSNWSKSSSCQPSPSLSSSLSSSPQSSSSVSGHEEEEYPDSEFVFTEACDLDSDDGLDRTSIAAQIEDKKSQREMAIGHTECKDQIPYKLRFRRGKMLNTLSDHSDTRRLRFRQGGRMGNIRSSEGEVDKINFKIKELICGESSHPDPEGQAVVLRHQDVQDKKDTVSLLNHAHSDTRRLRFRQGGRMGDIRSSEGEVDKINFKINELICGESSHPDPEGQAVVSRHQDVQDKKDTVSLFNHDHSGTRRLRFTQGRRMGDIRSSEGEVDKINFKIKELICGESSHPDPEAQAVVLRHQDVQDKKDTVSLLNHVIEETASKLVETRKSKVKALVGAFETVISLQERKTTTSV